MKGLIDSTLREGAQAVGVHFTLEQKTAILSAVSEIGIEEIEIGTSSSINTDLPYLISYCRQRLPKTAISVWSRCVKNDIAYAAELKPDVLSLSVPASDLHIEKKFKKSRKWVLSRLKKSVQFALKNGIKKVSVGFEDATRADESFLSELASCAQLAGAFRVRIADTVGIATPANISALVAKLSVAARHVEIGVHTHNDFGMATANAIAAIEAGAQWADVASLGLGERAGCARLEEVAGFFALNKAHTYRTKQLAELGRLVAQWAKKTISPNQPLIGSDIFSCETGLHLLGLEAEPKTYEPYHPESVGAQRTLVYGAKIGRKNILQRLQQLRQSMSKENIDHAFIHVRKKAIELGRPLNDTEFLAACSDL